jgi:hypothetical protein
MSIPVVEELRPLPLGIILALYPSNPTQAIEIERAPDSGGSPDTGSAVTVGVAEPGDRIFWDIVGGAGPYHYRTRHIRPNATPSAYTHWVAARPVVVGKIPNVPKLRAPSVQADWSRVTSTTATLTLTIYDPDRVVAAARLNKREGSEAADVFTGFVTTWDTSTGTIGTDAQLTRAENVTVEAGQESIIRWEVEYVDDDGVTHKIAGAQASQNSDEDSTTVYWPASSANALDDTVPVDRSNGDLRNRTAGSRQYVIYARLPVGVIVTQVAANLYRQDTDGTAQVQFIERFEASDIVSTTIIATLTHATTGYDVVTSGALSTTVANLRVYTFAITLDNASGAAADERLLWCRVTYTRKSQAQRI